MMRRVMLFAVAVVAALAMGGTAIAQPAVGPPPPPRPERAAGPLLDELNRMGEDDIRALVETVRMVRLSQELGLTDEQTVVLVRQYNETKELAGKLQKERQELARELRELVNTSAPEDALEKKLEQLVAKDKESLAMRFEAYERVSGELAPKQQAKLYLFMGDFEKRMRNLIETARQQFREGRGEGTREMRLREGGPRRGGVGAREGFGGRGGRERDGAAEPEEAPEQESPAPEKPE